MAGVGGLTAVLYPRTQSERHIQRSEDEEPAGGPVAGALHLDPSSRFSLPFPHLKCLLSFSHSA